MLPEKSVTQEDFFEALRKGDINTVFQFGDVNVVDADNENKTALHYAVESNNIELLNFLLSQRGINLNPRTKDEDPDIIGSINKRAREAFPDNPHSFQEKVKEEQYKSLGQTPLDLALYHNPTNLDIIFALVERAWDANVDNDLDGRVQYVDLERTRRKEADGFNGAAYGTDPRSSIILSFYNAFQHGISSDQSNAEDQKASIINLILQKAKSDDIIGDVLYLAAHNSKNYVEFVIDKALKLPNKFSEAQKTRLNSIKEELHQGEEELTPNRTSRQGGSFWSGNKHTTPTSSLLTIFARKSKEGLLDLELGGSPDHHAEGSKVRSLSFVSFSAFRTSLTSPNHHEDNAPQSPDSVEALTLTPTRRPSSITAPKQMKPAFVVNSQPSCCTLS